MIKRKVLTPLIAFAISVAAVFACFGTAACKKEPAVKPAALAAPVITLSDNVISWNAVEHATGYTVKKDAAAVSENQTATTYTITETAEGTYSFTVTALSTDKNYTQSPASNTVTYEVKPQQNPDVDTSVKFTGKIYVVGDSTVCGFTDKYYLPRYGYGTQLYNYINIDPANIENLALSGRSSKSFLSEANYTKLKNGITAGDYLIIGFGHNDEKGEADKYTNPNGDKDTAGSFQNSLYKNYVELANSKSATAILCTPIVRANKSNDYTGASGHVTETAGAYEGGDYAQAIRDLGAATGTAVVDLTAITAADYTALTYEKALDYHCFTATKNGVRVGEDTTHTNLYGAKMNAYHIAQEILKSDCALKANIITNSEKPSYEVDYPASINKSYVEPNYEAPDLTKRSAVWSTVKDTDWYASAFGDIGGDTAASASNYTIEQLSGNSFKIGNSSGKGKIASGGDGIANVFMQLDPNRNFEITAEVTLTTVAASASKQSAFGIMLRDEMYVDKYLTTANGNSVIAGGYTGSSDGANYCYNYQRLDGGLKASANTGTAAVFTQGETFTLKMVKTNRTIVCTVTKDGHDYSTTYTDVTFTGVDTDNVYLCLFATRGIVATFSDVNYTAGDIGTGA